MSLSTFGKRSTLVTGARPPRHLPVLGLFTARVELLHDALRSSDPYAVLHEAMASAGFSRHAAVDGVVCKLPPGEYNHRGSLGLDDVLEAARRAAETTGVPFRLLVSEVRSQRGYALEKAEERPGRAENFGSRARAQFPDA